MGGDKNVIGPKSSGALQGAGVNTWLEIGSEWAGIRGSWPSLHLSITMGTLKNNKTKKDPDAQVSARPIKMKYMGVGCW